MDAPPPPPTVSAVAKLLPQQETPTPKAKMKTINWNKIPDNKVVGRHNIWSLVARSHQNSPMPDLDWSEMEGLFCQQAPTAPTSQSGVLNFRLGQDNSECDRKRKEPTEIVLLDGKRSLNVNIFLKQFRSSNEDIIQLIRDGDHDDIGAEKLRGLLKILPELDELEMLRAFEGDKTKLGNAEKFLLQLIDIPNYKLRIESMLLKEEFASNMSYLEPSINSMIVAGEDLMTNKRFQEVLYMVICAGNFLNFGGYAGKAAGVKLSSLQKLTDIRANKPGMNLIHYVALQAEKNRKDLLKFPEEMSVLEEATKTTVEQLQNEINALDSRFKVVRKQIELPNTEQDIKNQMIEFLKVAERQVGGLQSDIAELESMRKTLADFFCEDINTFKLEECFRIVHSFCMKFRLAVAENERRKVQEEQALVRRKQREEQLAVKKRLLTNDQQNNGSDVESNLVDSILYDIRSGFPHKKSFDKGKRPHNATIVTSEEDNISVSGSPAVIRRRLGVVDNPNKEDNLSPDVTPNGSLRRRRSRVPSEEDEITLMDFLRTSNQDVPPVSNIQRKSWGSLDRSWARRFRGSGKKRPDLLSADFSADRERANSPSPVVETKPIVSTAASTPEEESKPKAWRQKIEAWLQENEKEDKESDDLRRKTQRVQNNRRSLENDSESDGRSSILDTLPEGKLANAKNDGYKRVYTDWRPTIDKTDVVGVMEAIAEAQPSVKDKSQWRKSNLNVPNTSEETDTNLKRSKKPTSLLNLDNHSTPLHAIKEEDKRKGFIEKLGQNVSNQDRLTVYIRGTDQPEIKSNVRSPSSLRKQLSCPDSPEEKLLPPFAPRRKTSDSTNPGDITDKIDIDSDNIETPPTSRRQIVKPQSIPLKIQTVEEENLGDGQFDRFSAARRTRRYRKMTEDDLGRKSEGYESPKANEETDVRLKKWKDKLMYKTSDDDNKDFSRNRLYSSMPRTTRNQSVVDHGDIMKAVKIYGQLSPEKSIIEPKALDRVTKINLHDNDESSIHLKSEFIPEIRVQALTPPIKIRTEHDLNDEGFEESVSLMSAESLSQETSSGNFETEKQIPKTIARADSSGSNDTNSSSGPVAPTLRKTNSLKSSIKPIVVRKTELPKRTSSFRTPQMIQKPTVKVIPSIKPIIKSTPVQKPTIVRTTSVPKPVERSSSKSSLRSSRSSLNSSNSVSTVKKIPGIATYTRAINDLTTDLKSKKPLNTLQLHNRDTPVASRSSISGSSIAIPVNKPKSKPLSTSFKENQGRSGMTGITPSRKSLGFMRPTASSTAKDLVDSSKPMPLVKKNFK